MIALFMCLLLGPLTAWTQPITVHDKASLQNGAKLYMNYCAGCHSLGYLRYNQMAKDIGIVQKNGQVDEVLLKNNLVFTQANLDDVIQTAMPTLDAKRWFGVAPPDLSLMARVKGSTWLTAYLSGFYADDSRPFGVNNVQSHDVAMPNVVESLTEKQVQDIVAFLVYVSEPVQLIRYEMGVLVIIFLSLLFLMLWLYRK